MDNPKRERWPMNIPEDIILSEIVVRLPIKSVCRFKCVSKRWKSIISDPEFGNQRRARESSSPPLTTLLYPFSTGSENSLNIQERYDDGDELSIGMSWVSSISNKDHQILASSKGLILSLQLPSYPRFVLCVSNPLTKQSVQLPNSTTSAVLKSSAILVFGFVARPDLMTYKVVLIQRPPGKVVLEQYIEAESVEIFSSDTGRWATVASKLRFPKYILTKSADPCISYKGVLHWLADDTIITYDPYNSPDRLGSIPLPPKEDARFTYYSTALMYSGDENLLRFCVIKPGNSTLLGDTLSVWRLVEDGNNHEWSFEGKLQFPWGLLCASNMLVAPIPGNHDVFCVPYASRENKLMVINADWSRCESVSLLQRLDFHDCCETNPLIPVELCPWASPFYAQHPTSTHYSACTKISWMRSPKTSVLY